jgi:periplasmic protein TonB
MFDTVLGKGNVPKGRFGVGTIVSIMVHIGLIGFAIWMSVRPPPEEDVETDVTFFAAPPPPPPPPAARSRPKTERKETKRVEKKPDTLFRPKDQTPQEPQPEEEPEEEEVEGGVVGGVEGGVIGGVIGGTLGGSLGGQLGGEAVAFGEGMTRPELLSGPAKPPYTREALEARVEGTMLIRCTLTAEGIATNCRIIKPLPHMEESVLNTLKAQRYKPVTFQGRPISVEYVFNFRFVLPNR